MDSERQKTQDGNKNVIFVGAKPPMNYVLAVVSQFHGGAKEVHLKARGRAICRAVDIAEITRNKFMTDIKVESVSIGTESVSGEQGTPVNVSSIDICLVR